ncbi:hypothetical protein BAE40_30145 [Mesorhizobium loti]|nr:hypothetical protein BAE40_30145 [Mesorhizobium loti]
MTDDMTNMRALLERNVDSGLLRDMIGLLGERVMDLEVGAAIGAAYDEARAPRQAAHRALRIFLPMVR